MFSTIFSIMILYCYCKIPGNTILDFILNFLDFISQQNKENINILLSILLLHETLHLDAIQWDWRSVRKSNKHKFHVFHSSLKNNMNVKKPNIDLLKGLFKIKT